MATATNTGVITAGSVRGLAPSIHLLILGVTYQVLSDLLSEAQCVESP